MRNDWPHPLPAPLTVLVRGAEWQAVTIGCSGVMVFRLTGVAAEAAPGITKAAYAGYVRLPESGQSQSVTAYLKIAPRGAEFPLEPEYARIQWLQERLPVPAVKYYGGDAQYEYLLLTAVPGLMACDAALAADVPRVVRLLAAGLRMIHAIPITHCPFVMNLDARLAEAEARIAAGLVNIADVEPENMGRAPEALYAELLATRPASEDLVFTHGDYCLPNVLLAGDQLGGFIDWARAGVADRYMDLAIAARSLARNWGAEWVPLLLQEYGIAAPDVAKMRYYRLLDEMF